MTDAYKWLVPLILVWILVMALLWVNHTENMAKLEIEKQQMCIAKQTIEPKKSLW